MSNAVRSPRVLEHYDNEVKDLVAAHAKLTHSPLALAVRYQFGDAFDVHLLEIIENFPGGEEDPPLMTVFEPSERLRILGKLHLMLANLPQLKNAVERAKGRSSGSKSKEEARLRAAMKAVLKTGRVVHEARSPKNLAAVARKAKATLGLK